MEGGRPGAGGPDESLGSIYSDQRKLLPVQNQGETYPRLIQTGVSFLLDFAPDGFDFSPLRFEGEIMDSFFGCELHSRSHITRRWRVGNQAKRGGATQPLVRLGRPQYGFPMNSHTFRTMLRPLEVVLRPPRRRLWRRRLVKNKGTEAPCEAARRSRICGSWGLNMVCL